MLYAFVVKRRAIALIEMALAATAAVCTLTLFDVIVSNAYWYTYLASFLATTCLYLFFPVQWIDCVGESRSAEAYATCEPFAPTRSLYNNTNVPASEAFWLEEYGDPQNPVVVVFGGMPTSNVSKITLIGPLINQGFFVALIDYPGTGFGQNLPFTVSETVRRTKAYASEMQPIPGRPLVLFGSSAGANIALRFAAEFPKLVHGVVASGAAYGYAPRSGWLPHPLALKTKVESRITPMQLSFRFVAQRYCALGERMLTTSPRCEDDGLDLIDADNGDDGDDDDMQTFYHRRDLLARFYFSRVDRDALALEMKRLGERVRKQSDAFAPYGICPHVYAEYMDEFCRADMDAALAHVRCPVLLMWGAGDPARTLFGGSAALIAALPATTPRTVVTVNAHRGALDHMHDGIYPRRLACCIRRFYDRIAE